MSSELPLRIDPLRLVDQQTSLRGTLELARMKRLGEMLVRRTGAVHVSLRFSRNAGGLKAVTGDIKTHLELQCQRCLKPFTQVVDRRFELVLAQGEAEADGMLAEHEVLEVGESSIFTQDLIEDELLLSMPLIPVHDDPPCGGFATDWQTTSAPPPGNAVEEKPGHSLAAALRKLTT